MTQMTVKKIDDDRGKVCARNNHDIHTFHKNDNDDVVQINQRVSNIIDKSVYGHQEPMQYS